MRYEDLEDKIGDSEGISIVGSAAATSTNYGVFFTARHPVEVMWIAESHTTATSTSGSLDVLKLTSSQAIASGRSILVNKFNLDSTANTPVIKEGYTGLGTVRILEEGDRLALATTGTLASLQGVQVQVYYKYSNLGEFK